MQNEACPDSRPLVLGISGSPRRRGNSATLLRLVLESLPASSLRTETVSLKDLRFSACTGCERCRTSGACTGLNDDMQRLYPLVVEARALVLVSPVHNYNITAWMKAFIDRLYCFYTFDDSRPRGWSSRLAGQGRKALIAVIGEQPLKRDLGVALQALRLPLEALGYEITDAIDVRGIFDAGALAAAPRHCERAAAAGRALAAALKSG